MQDLSQSKQSTWRPRAAEGVETHEVADGYILYQSDRDRVHHLNPTAAVLLALCTGRNCVTEMPELLRLAFNLASPPVAETRVCLEQLVAEKSDRLNPGAGAACGARLSNLGFLITGIDAIKGSWAMFDTDVSRDFIERIDEVATIIDQRKMVTEATFVAPTPCFVRDGRARPGRDADRDIFSKHLIDWLARHECRIGVAFGHIDRPRPRAGA